MTQTNRTNIAVLISTLAYIPVLLAIETILHGLDPDFKRASIMLPAVLSFSIIVMSVLYACRRLSYRARMNIVFIVQMALVFLGFLERFRNPQGMGPIGDLILVLITTFAISRVIRSDDSLRPKEETPEERSKREKDRLRAGVISLSAGVIFGAIGTIVVIHNPMFLVLVVFGGWIPVAVLLILGVGLVGEHLLRRRRT